MNAKGASRLICNKHCGVAKELLDSETLKAVTALANRIIQENSTDPEYLNEKNEKVDIRINIKELANFSGKVDLYLTSNPGELRLIKEHKITEENVSIGFKRGDFIPVTFYYAFDFNLKNTTGVMHNPAGRQAVVIHRDDDVPQNNSVLRLAEFPKDPKDKGIYITSYVHIKEIPEDIKPAKILKGGELLGKFIKLDKNGEVIRHADGKKAIEHLHLAQHYITGEIADKIFQSRFAPPTFEFRISVADAGKLQKVTLKCT